MIHAPSRRRWLRWWTAGGLIVVVSVMLRWQMQPKVLVGRDWPIAERVSLDRIPHAAWTDLLSRYVDVEGSVDYGGWLRSADDLRRLNEYLEHLSQANLDLPASQPERLAFWINAYNAVTVRGILREYPTSSIQNHAARVWGYNIWRDLCLRVNGHDHSLGQIEHELLRPLNEPRVHFAIVCASRGCPRLLNEAYVAERIDEQLAHNTAAFFADSTKCRFDSTKRELQLSPLLHWYAQDFGSTATARLKTIAPWLPDEEARRLALADQLTMTYLDYDWSLNDRATAVPADKPPLPPPESGL